MPSYSNKSLSSHHHHHHRQWHHYYHYYQHYLLWYSSWGLFNALQNACLALCSSLFRALMGLHSLSLLWHFFSTQWGIRNALMRYFLKACRLAIQHTYFDLTGIYICLICIHTKEICFHRSSLFLIIK